MAVFNFWRRSEVFHAVIIACNCPTPWSNLAAQVKDTHHAFKEFVQTLQMDIGVK